MNPARARQRHKPACQLRLFSAKGNRTLLGPGMLVWAVRARERPGNLVPRSWASVDPPSRSHLSFFISSVTLGEPSSSPRPGFLGWKLGCVGPKLTRTAGKVPSTGCRPLIWELLLALLLAQAELQSGCGLGGNSCGGGKRLTQSGASFLRYTCLISWHLLRGGFWVWRCQRIPNGVHFPKVLS